MQHQNFIALTEPQLETLLERAAALGADKALQSFGTTPDVMNKAQLAKYWQCSVATIDRYMKIGMPFKKIAGGSPRFYKSECDSWRSINAGTKSP